MKLDISILQRLLWLRAGRITPKAYRRPSAWSGYGVRGHIPSLFITLTGLSVSSRLQCTETKRQGLPARA